MAKPISFKDVEVDPPWEIEYWIRQDELRKEAHLQVSVGELEDEG